MSLDDLPRIALVQMHVLPGRPDGNAARMLAHIARARAARAEMVVFSELCIPGYILGDLWELDALVGDFAAWSDAIREASAGITVVFGNVHVDRERIGEDGRLRKYNAVHVVRDGEYVAREGLPAGGPGPGVHPKTLHPNYRFFDDDRHFYSLRKLAASTGSALADWMVPFEIPREGGGRFRFGVQLCEDMWCQDYRHDGEVLDTLRMFRARGASAVFNLSASPWTWQKNEKRNRVVREILSRSGVWYCYVNQVGAQNNGKNVLVFDGDTTVYAPDGRIVQRASPWRETMLLSDDPSPRVAAARSEEQSNLDGIVTGLRHLDEVLARDNRFLIGVSGGVDSSLVACLLVEAFGAERVFAVNMPTRFNAEVTRSNARDLCARLGVDYLSCPIESLYTAVAALVSGASFARDAGDYSGLVDENLQARIRGADVLAGLAAKHGLLFSNNGNKTEVALGYATLYGDVNGAIAPIADLYKTQVLALAEHLNDSVYGRETIPRNLLDGSTVPSAELSADQDVTRGLGDPIKYGYHDALLRQMIEYRHHPADILSWALDGTLLAALGFHDVERFADWFPDSAAWVADLEWIERSLRASYFKRIQAPPVIVLSKRAFGFDLRESQLPPYAPREFLRLKEEVLRRPMGELAGRP